jgi:hypothetical protein
VIIYLELGLVLPIFKLKDKNNHSTDVNVFLKEIELIGYPSQNIDSKRLLVILQPSDFNCPTCLDDFVYFNNLIITNLDSIDRMKIYCYFYQEIEDSLSEMRINRFIEALDIRYNCIISKSEKNKQFIKSTAILIDSTGKILYKNEFPMGTIEHKKFIELIKN